jgi:hypothetical protein
VTARYARSVAECHLYMRLHPCSCGEADFPWASHELRPAGYTRARLEALRYAYRKLLLAPLQRAQLSTRPDSNPGTEGVSGDEQVPWLVDPAGQRPRPETLVQVDPPREVGGFRFATVIDGVAADGAPVVDERRGWITEPARRERILQYLRGGATVFHNAVAFGPDYLDPTRRFAVPTGYRTDGAWIWPMSAEYYLEQHGVAPEPEFYARIRHYGYRCPLVIQQQVDQALAALRERTRMLEEQTAAPPTDRFPADVATTLTRSGWRPGRDVADQVDAWFDELALDELRQDESWSAWRSAAVAAARHVLREFGGLVADIGGPGRDHAVSPFRLYPLPSPALNFPDVYGFGYLEGKLDRPLFPIGEVDDFQYDLAIDPDGRIYQVGDLDFALGEDIDEALVNLVQGRAVPRVGQAGG